MKDKIVAIWSEGFPHKHSASNEKNFLLAKALVASGVDVVLTSKLNFNVVDSTNAGVYEGVRYENFHNYKIKSKHIAFCFAIIGELAFLKKLNKEYNNVFLLASFVFFPLYVFYLCFARSFKVKIILSIMEWHISIYKNSSVSKKINAYFFDTFAPFLSAGSIVISDYIASQISNQTSKEKVMLIPVLSDFNRVISIPKLYNQSEKYILYCGGIGYIEVIELVLESFVACQNQIDQHLYLIVHGSENQINKLKSNIASLSVYNRIHVFTALTYESLIQLYKSADLLLVPLRDNQQDGARYPQKIAEYSACARPIISNQIGQVAVDFKHLENIYFAEDFSADSLTKAIVDVLKNSDLSNKIANNAFLKGQQFFDCYIYSEPMRIFLNKIK